MKGLSQRPAKRVCTDATSDHICNLLRHLFRDVAVLVGVGSEVEEAPARAVLRGVPGVRVGGGVGELRARPYGLVDWPPRGVQQQFQIADDQP